MSEASKTKLRWLSSCAMLVALEIVLNRFCSINTAGLKIGFSFIPPMLAAMLYGPATSALVYALSDFLGALLFPIGPYHPGFTVCAAGMGLMLGLKTVRPASEVIAACMEKGVLCLSAKDKVRLLPALNIPMETLKKAADIILSVCAE